MSTRSNINSYFGETNPIMAIRKTCLYNSTDFINHVCSTVTCEKGTWNADHQIK